VEAEIDRVQGFNVWLLVGLREGKNREVKRVLEHLGLSVNRLIRISYGPFQLGDLKPGEAREVRGRVLRDQLGEKLARAAGADFDAPIRTGEAKEEKRPRALHGRRVTDEAKPKRGDKPEARVRSGAAESRPPRGPKHVPGGHRAADGERQRGKPPPGPRGRGRPDADRRR
jgi:23S rRNA pseudouridine2605 synthase